jgi:hypothetical protein
LPPSPESAPPGAAASASAHQPSADSPDGMIITPPKDGRDTSSPGSPRTDDSAIKGAT